MHKDHGWMLLAFVSMHADGNDPHTPNWSSMVDNAITQSGIEGLGSPFYICGVNSLELVFIVHSSSTAPCP